MNAGEALDLLSAGTERWYSAARIVGHEGARSGQVDRLEAVARVVAATPPAAGADAARRRALARLAWPLSFHGRAEVARRLLDDVLASMDETPDPMVEAIVLGVKAHWAMLAGDPELHLDLAERAVLEFVRAGDSRGASFARTNLAFAQLGLGQHELAERQLREAIASAERLGNMTVVVHSRSNLALALLGQARLTEARAEAIAALEGCTAGRDMRVEGATRVYLATIEARLGDLASAQREALFAIERLATAPPLLAYARATLAGALLRQGRLVEARSTAARAMDEIARHGAEEGAETIELVWAETLDATGDRAAAAEAIGRARERLQVQAARIRSEALRRSFLEAVPVHARTMALAREWLG
ncbi:MAG: hypothetical protein HYY06_07120 [Deltaproteobacteria bacterium]|nr:hypothetical protein [Deltaproteobacteria bacterium]